MMEKMRLSLDIKLESNSIMRTRNECVIKLKPTTHSEGEFIQMQIVFENKLG